MSEVPTSKIEIYIPLLDEGTDVSRPTEATIVGPGEFLVLPTPDYDPELEHWEFPPGSVVQCVRKQGFDGDDYLRAQKRLR
jgi:hypothetical protein